MEITPDAKTQSDAPPLTHFGVANLFTVEDALNLARANSMWPLTFGLACCAIELMAAGASRFDLDRFGYGAFRPSPRQADLMIVAGTISRKMVPCIKTLYDQMPAPKYVIALGGCATAGGPFKYPGQYGILEGIDKIIPVNVYVPGCPPRPEALIAGILELQKQIKTGKIQATLSPAVVKDSQDNRPAEYKTRSQEQILESRYLLQPLHPLLRPRLSSDAAYRPQDIQTWLRDSLKADEFNSKDLKTSGVLFEAVVPSASIKNVASEFLKNNYFLESLTAVDFSECFELVYHFNQWEACKRCVIKVVLDKNSNAPSIAAIYKSANWFEREIFDLFGIRFEGHPDLKRILLPDSSTIHPLLKSFKGEPAGSDVTQSLKLIEEDKQGFEIQYPKSISQHKKDYYLNLGPQHPSTHGVLRVLLHLDGERVLDGEPVLGYSHRHQEKMMEIQNYLACWPNMGRLDYVGAMSYNFGYALLIEKAMGIAPPPRVEAIRVLTTELNRISSHLLWMGTFLLDLGGFTPFFYAFDDRENILDLLEMVTGERLTYDYFRFGGLDKDIPAEFIPAVKKFIPRFKERLRDYDKLVTQNIIFEHRTKGLGIISKETALQYGVTGPMLRACGVGLDLRRQEPYSIYSQLDFDVPTEKDGDVYARFKVRFREMHESLKIVQQLIDKIPAGEVTLGKLPKNVPKGEYYSAVESARGTFGIYLVSDGTLNPYRIKLRTPSFSNLNSFIDMLPGLFMSDVIAVLGSTDIVLPEIDR